MIPLDRGPRTGRRLRFLWGPALATVLACGPEAPVAVESEPTTFELAGTTMGTTWLVKVVAQPETPAPELVQRAIVEALDEVDRKMSTWKEDSEISRFNAYSGEEWFSVSAETQEVLGVALAVSRASRGAFDVTVGPLVDAWGFGPVGEPPEAPDAAVLEELRARVGFDHLMLDRSIGGVAKGVPGLEVDLSAIAKGYAVDRVSSALRRLGERDFMVEVGGEVRTSGRNPDGRPWRIAIEVPRSDVRELYTVVPLTDRALATSGDYRNYYELDGHRVSHTLDPRSGRPIEHRTASVSVVSEECVLADAWATALLVLGEEGLDLAEEQGLAALFIVRRPDGSFVSRATTSFDELVDGAGGEPVS